MIEPVTSEVDRILVFKTNLESVMKIRQVRGVMDHNPLIKGWNIDLDDIDNVLRVETFGQLNEAQIIKLIESVGFRCEVLTH